MANNDNLIPFSERTESEQRAIQIAGGKASGEARRKRKALKEQAEMLLGLPLQDIVINKKSKRTLAEEIQAFTGVNKDEIDNQFAMLVVRLTDALNTKSNTSVQSFNCLIEAVGEKNTKLDVNGGVTINFSGENDIAD